ncbi:hypothetical protein ACFVZH_35990 [Streptomyces sp. NPDC059534]|uniref:hypothetical protein n=1 Tax=Streptomyces sp. NPDC059534 TaxID=3346859 RepID=UPI0036A1EE97
MSAEPAPPAVVAVTGTPLQYKGEAILIATDRADTILEILPAGASKSGHTKVAEQIEVDYADSVLRIVTPTPKDRLFGNSGSVGITVLASFMRTGSGSG